MDVPTVHANDWEVTVGGGPRWSALAAIGLHWLSWAFVGRWPTWPTLAFAGLRWPVPAAVGPRWLPCVFVGPRWLSWAFVDLCSPGDKRHLPFGPNMARLAHCYACASFGGWAMSLSKYSLQILGVVMDRFPFRVGPGGVTSPSCCGWPPLTTSHI